MSREQLIDSIFKQCGTDKNSESHNYARIYAMIPWDIENMLEIGVGGGQSILSWLQIFPKAQVYCVDMNAPGTDKEEFWNNPRVHFLHTDIRDLRTDNLPQFDLIVDDASHEPDGILTGWQKLQPYLRGTYVIEDISESAIFPVLSGVPNTASMIVTKHAGDNRVIMWSADGYKD